jgi:hypothetical protein
LNGAVGTVGIPKYFNPTAFNPPGIQWREISAEEFAIASGGGLDPVLDGRLSNPLFNCSRI